MKVFLERTKETKELEFEGKVIDLLKKLNVNSEEVIVIKNSEIVTLNSTLKNEDELQVLSVISGG